MGPSRRTTLTDNSRKFVLAIYSQPACFLVSSFCSSDTAWFAIMRQRRAKSRYVPRSAQVADDACWLLFVTLFPLDMSVEAMAGVTLVIFAEKTLPWPKLTPRITAVALVLYDALVIASPQLLPSFQKTDGSAPMPAEMQMKMPKAATHRP
jgi:hypothetical protein